MLISPFHHTARDFHLWNHHTEARENENNPWHWWEITYMRLNGLFFGGLNVGKYASPIDPMEYLQIHGWCEKVEHWQKNIWGFPKRINPKKPGPYLHNLPGTVTFA